MSAERVAIRESDLKMVEIYQDFLPKKVFDAHIHLYHSDTIPAFRGSEGNFFLDAAVPADYVSNIQPLMPGVEEFRLNMMPMVDKALTDVSNGLRAKANEYVIRQARENPQHVASVYILPRDTEQDIGDMISAREVCGLKPYYYGMEKPDANCAIGEFLPEAAWVVANETGLPIILHMMRQKSLADPDNFAYINTMCHRYPNAKLVLAHCGRGFAGWTAVKQISKLIDDGNIWFDMAAICEVGPMFAAITKNAAKRTMWGTDWPICLHRGRAISMAHDQLWITETDKKTNYALLAAESLLAFYQTSLLLDLDQTQIADIFHNNAAALFSRG